MFTRTQTRSLKIGNLPLGGGAPVSVQTMANVDPHDAAALAAQVARCAEAGADLVRLTVPDLAAARVLGEVRKTSPVPLVADMSSCILSEPVDVSKFGLIYAGAQKNVAPAGLTIVIVREDLIGHAREDIPTVMDYKVQAENGSMYNTPPCWPIYIAGLVFDWVASMGGLEAMKEYNAKKAAILYDYLDSQSYYVAPVEKPYRSMMNVTFVTGDADLDAKFASEAAAAGLKNVKGHRSVGGMRASIYNAMPTEGVKTLVSFMEEFAKNNPKG